MLESPLSARLETCERVLVAGAGGGFDVYAGLPLALALREQGKETHLANLSFSRLDALDLDAWLAEDVAAIVPDTHSRDWYLPERALARWLAAHGLPATVYAFPKLGVRPLRAAYARLAAHLRLDAVILVDGGTDILMRGDEAGLGTPVEDMASLAAVHGLDLPEYPSIVNGSIAAAVRGEFGDVRFTERTRGSELFVNPLMALYFAVDLDGLARRSLYLDRIEDTVLARQIAAVVEAYREEITPRPPKAFPH